MADQITIRWLGGNCPVQAEGTIDGKEFYFRARYDSWSLSIGDDPIGSVEWEYEEPYGTPDGYDAGWMSEDEARAFISKAAKKYTATRRSDV